MDWTEIDKRIKNIYEELFYENYNSGAPKIPPHTHNGVDNLEIASRAGKPAGSDMDIQFNDGGVFGGDDNFQWDKTSQILRIAGTLGVDNITTDPANFNNLDISTPNGGQSITIETDTNNTNASGNIVIKTNDPDLSGNNASGSITMQTGGNKSNSASAAKIFLKGGTGIGNHHGGAIELQAGDSQSGTPGSINLDGNQDINLTTTIGASGASTSINLSAQGASAFVSTASAGAMLTTAVDQMIMNLSSGQSVITLNKDGGGNGQITLDANIFTSIAPYRGGSTTGNIAFFFGLSGSALGANSAGTFFIGEAQNAPTGNPVLGGQLYVSGGALMYRGSGGTVTMVAPA